MQILSPLRAKAHTREEKILQVLLDKQCLAILNITKEKTMTAPMICSCCDISPSTAYRKLKLLRKLNLLRTTYTIQPGGKKSMSFQNKITRINILLFEKQLCIHSDFVSLE